jgi:hypothetical protein
VNLHRFTQRIIYRLKAHNRHGIHSPFVYDLVDKCLLVDTHLPVTTRLENYFGNPHLLQTADLSTLAPDNVLLIPDIHASAENTSNWNTLRSNDRVLLSIDLFELGLLITRPEFKEKQHFVLKTR